MNMMIGARDELALVSLEKSFDHPDGERWIVFTELRLICVTGHT
jgi:hypothetical protein